MNSSIVEVAAAVIVRADGQVLLAQRPEGKAYAGYWEFPGGKLEPGESAAAALARELQEELGLRVIRATPWLTQEFVYPHAHVMLRFFRVFEWTGEPIGHDGQAFAWQTPGDFSVAPLLPANTRVLSALTLPPVYGITCADDLGESEFLNRAQRAFAAGLRLIQMREKRWPVERRDAFALQLRTLAEQYAVRVLLNGNDENAARRLGLAGVHWTAADLACATTRPTDMLVAASCHTAAEIGHAGGLGLDFAVLGTVKPTPTHPHAPPLGWSGLRQLLQGNRLPVYALGGLTATDLDIAIASGAQGVALRRGAWS